MKLFVLFFNLLTFLLDVIYYIITSPWLLIKYFINRKAQKIVKVGDDGLFKNILDSYTKYVVKDIRNDKIRIDTGNGSQWISKKDHKII